MARFVRATVTGKVQQHDPVAPFGEVGGETTVHLAVEQDAMEEDDDPVAVAVGFEVESEASGLEPLLVEGTALSQRGDGSDCLGCSPWPAGCCRAGWVDGMEVRGRG